MEKRQLRVRRLGSSVREEEDQSRRYSPQEVFQQHRFCQDHGFVCEMKGKDFSLWSVQSGGFKQALVFRDKAGLGMKLPPHGFTVSDVHQLVGARRQVDVMDTCTQEATVMSMQQWSSYFASRPRERLLNVISLEFSCTRLDPLVQPPTVVRQLDWVEQAWPRHLKQAQTDPTNNLHTMMYPKVQKYCLMSVGGCFTDFHLDFGGTSVWYHLLSGEKWFLLVPPTADNYSLFVSWQLSGRQDCVFFADLVERAQLVRLEAGHTMLMPAGWIHAVYTPWDSLVFGGNFLHSFNIEQQLRVAEVECTTEVPAKQRFPFYGAIHWYTLLSYRQALEARGVAAVLCDQTMSSNDLCQQTLQLDCQPGAGQWLKEVSVERVGELAANERDEGRGFESKEDKEVFPCVDHHSKYSISIKVSPESRKRLSLSFSPDLELVANSSTPPRVDDTHLSSFEREGLLCLIEKMQNDKLFHCDVPPSIASPSALLAGLRRQLWSPSLISPATPSSLTTLTPRKRKRSSRASERCARKHHCGTKFIISLPLSLLLPPSGHHLPSSASEAIVCSIPLELASLASDLSTISRTDQASSSSTARTSPLGSGHQGRANVTTEATLI